MPRNYFYITFSLGVRGLGFRIKRRDLYSNNCSRGMQVDIGFRVDEGLNSIIQKVLEQYF